MLHKQKKIKNFVQSLKVEFLPDTLVLYHPILSCSKHAEVHCAVWPLASIELRLAFTMPCHIFVKNKTSWYSLYISLFRDTLNSVKAFIKDKYH